MSDVEEIKAALDIVDVISETVDLTDCGGNEWKGALNPGSQSGKSLNVNRDMQVWHDWPSDTGGTALDWVAHINNIDIKTDFKKVLEIAADKAGVQLNATGNYQDTKEVYTLIGAAVQWYHNQLTTDHRTHIKAKWGLSDESINKYKIGYAPGEERATALQAALREVFPVELIRSSGLINATNKGWVSHYQDRIVFPYWQGGRVVYSIARSMAEDDKDKYLKHLVKGPKHKHVDASIKNVIAGQDSLQGTDHCIITEGITDCLMVQQAGIPCVSPVTTRFQDDDHVKILDLVKDLKTVYICNDSEDSGEGAKGALATADILRGKGHDVRIIQLPRPEGVDKIDLADFLRDNPAEDFKDLMRAAEATPKEDQAKSCKACKYCRDGINDKGHEWAKCALHDEWLNPYHLYTCVDWEAPIEQKKAKDTTKGHRGPYYNERNQFVAKALGDEILSEHNIITLADTRQLLLYSDGVFRPDAEDMIKNICMRKLGDDYKRDRTSETIEYIRLNTLTDRDEINTNTYLVNTKNGMVDVINDKILPHDPGYKSTVQINVKYDPEAQCSAIDKFLHDVTYPEFVPLLYQVIGYCLVPDISLQKALVLDGGTGNGKSVFIDLVMTLIGKKYSSIQSIQRLNNNRFATAALDGKLLNVFTDLPSEKLRDNSVFKMVTADKTIGAEIKGGRCYEFKNITHHIYSANQLPELENMDEMAFFRRLLCVTFPYTFDGDKDDKHILDKLITENELSGLLNVALIGLRALIEHEEFCYNPSVFDVQQTYLIKSNPVQYFIDSCTERGGEHVTKKDLHEVYTEWCRTSKPTSILKANAFGRMLKKLGYVDGRLSDYDRPRIWVNLSLSQESRLLYDKNCPGYMGRPGSVPDRKKTGTEKNQLTDDDNMSSCPCTHVLFNFLEYNNIYRDIYSTGGVQLDVGTTWTPGQNGQKKEQAAVQGQKNKKTTRTDTNETGTDTIEHLVIRLHADVPAFQGTDGINYNLNINDVASIPESNARVFIDRGIATEIPTGGEA